MENNFTVKQITRLYDSCNQCGLPTLTCICNVVTPINTKAQFWIIASRKEFYRPSSTGRLLKLINPNSTEIFLWERNHPSPRLIENIKNYKERTYLVFPADQLVDKTVSTINDGEVAFILVDGTWKEAKKIVRKSEYLKDLPLVSIKPDHESIFDLRRGRLEGTLCTIEAAIETLRLVGETGHGQVLRKYFNLFLKHYKAGVSSHLPKD